MMKCNDEFYYDKRGGSLISEKSFIFLLQDLVFIIQIVLICTRKYVQNWFLKGATTVD